ncbi:MAG: DUF1289 domain-containing protein [Pseudomonadota bacterium]|nr:DUF1289 domain-containing protein [Pseudomonadota bacterium]
MATPQDAKPPGTVPSPCTDVCRIDPVSGWCEGCMRTLDEIAAWGELADLQKRAIWKRLPARRAEAALRHAERTPP